MATHLGLMWAGVLPRRSNITTTTSHHPPPDDDNSPNLMDFTLQFLDDDPSVDELIYPHRRRRPQQSFLRRVVSVPYVLALLALGRAVEALRVPLFITRVYWRAARAVLREAVEMAGGVVVVVYGVVWVMSTLCQGICDILRGE